MGGVFIRALLTSLCILNIMQSIKQFLVKRLQKMLKEGYLKENYHYFHLRDTAGDERDFHFHEFDKIVILLSGKVDYAVENEIYALRPWEVLLVKHHSIHKALIDKSEPYDRVIIYLDENRYSRLMPEAGLTRCFDRCLYSPDETVLRELLSKIESTDAEVLRETYIIELLAILNSLKGEAPDVRNYDEKTQAVLTYINENISSPLTVDELAGYVHLSKYHFMRRFKENTGQTVHSYVRQQRLLYASRLIREGIPASQAAGRSGFDDYSVFYKAFKDNFGISPKELKT